MGPEGPRGEQGSRGEQGPARPRGMKGDTGCPGRGTSWFGWAYQVYRIDATNVANIELVPNITYVSSTVWTYIVDDDIVINGWYFVNYSATELPEHLKSGGIPPFFRVRP